MTKRNAVVGWIYLRVARRRPDHAAAAFRDGENRRDAFLAEIGVVGLALQAPLGLLFKREFRSQHVELGSVLQTLVKLGGLCRQSFRGFLGDPVGNDLFAHLVKRAIPRRRDAFHLE